MKITSTTEQALAIGDTTVVGLFTDEPPGRGPTADAIQSLLDSGEAKSTFKHLALTHLDARRRLLIVGLGRRQQFSAERARVVSAVVYGRVTELGTEHLVWEVPAEVSEQVAAALVKGAVLRAYTFARPGRRRDDAERHSVNELTLSASVPIDAAVQRATVVATAQNRVRDLVNRPANDLTPTALAEYAQSLPSMHPEVSVTVLDEQEIRAMGMGGFAAVAQGSEQPAKLIHLSYEGGEPNAPKLALLGKGVTFDTGGYWLKPKAGMQEMISDMAGGAAVIEALAAIAELRIPINVIAVVGSTENMISGQAMRPGDIVTALDGTTVEVLNTDAEGRMVLGDCIAYAIREGASTLVDVATLTGGVVTALGSAHAGLFANDDALAQSLLAAGERTGELLWRLPLHRHYAKMVRGRVADITNLTERREAQASTAAEFLHHFARDTPWAHLDIAGTAYNVRGPYIADKGGTGFGLRLLVDLAENLASP